MQEKPKNLFCTSHFLSVIGVLYITALSPAIDKAISEGLTKKEIGHLINSTLVGVVAGSLKMLDKDAYTPKFLPGRDKNKALNNLSSTTNQETIENNVNDVKTQVDKNINTVTTETINSIIPNNNTFQNTAIRAILPNVVNSYNDSITSNLNNDINNTDNNISDETAKLFKTKDVLKNNNEEVKNNIQHNVKYGSDYHSNLLINKQLTNIVIKAKQDTFYKFEPVDSSKLSNDKKIKIESEVTIYIDSYNTNNITNNHIQFSINGVNLYAFIPHITIINNNIAIDKEVDLINTNNFRPTIEQCNELYNTILTEEEYNDLIKCLNTFNINTKIDVAHFLSQVGHESAGLRYMKELGDYNYFSKNYDYRNDLGNTEPGDGAKFSGVGPIQMTGRYNYQAFADFIKDQKVMQGVDYVASKYFFLPSGFWWFNNEISDYINNKNATVEQVSARVNGKHPANGLQDRLFYFSRCKKIFSIT
jgi:predicted chitinase